MTNTQARHPVPGRDRHDQPPQGGVPTYRWGNAVYVDLAVGESYAFGGTRVSLVSSSGDGCIVRVGEHVAPLIVARRQTPKIVGGVRIFLADTRGVKALTTDPAEHGALTRDALLGLSDPAAPLLDGDRFVFPISRQDGFVWSMAENSHMFAYLGHAPYIGGEGYYRSHEGIDIDLHDARGALRHPLVAIEDARVVWVESSRQPETAVLLESSSSPGVWYGYQHLYTPNVYVSPGQSVRRGDVLAHIWGDGRWGHLHFAVVTGTTPPAHRRRYTNLLNCFPQLYELWNGDAAERPRVWASGAFTFGRSRWLAGNTKRASAFCSVLGYGWDLDGWCAAQAVEYPPDGNDGRGPENVRLRKVLHRGTAAEAINPNNYTTFSVAVENGIYAVTARVGDYDEPSWQRVDLGHQDAGTFDLDAGEYAWAGERRVPVADGRLTIRLHHANRETCSGLSELRFVRVE